MNRKLIIDCISDTHNKHKQIKLAGGDILIHSGDCTSMGRLSETLNFLDWFADQDYSHLILVPGNHDWIFELNPSLMTDECKKRNIVLLNDSGIEIEGIKIWGSPITPWFHSWAFNRHRGAEIKKHWDMIPKDTDILITHGPAHGILDFVPRGEFVGCADLLKRIYETNVKLHTCGHIHWSKGHRYIDGRTFVNAASLNEQYQVVENPITRIVRDVDLHYIVEE